MTEAVDAFGRELHTGDIVYDLNGGIGRFCQLWKRSAEDPTMVRAKIVNGESLTFVDLNFAYLVRLDGVQLKEDGRLKTPHSQDAKVGDYIYGIHNNSDLRIAQVTNPTAVFIQSGLNAFHRYLSLVFTPADGTQFLPAEWTKDLITFPNGQRVLKHQSNVGVEALQRMFKKFQVTS